MTLIAPTLEAFFTERLAGQRKASPRTGRQASRLDFADLDARLIGAFLDHLETGRGNSTRTRKCPAGGHPLAVPLRRAAPSRRRRGQRAGAGDPTQTLRPGPDHLPHRGGNHGFWPLPTRPPGPGDATTPC
jgi:hypothetical protein